MSTTPTPRTSTYYSNIRCDLLGDLKPENLLLANNDDTTTLKIADFGLSAIFAMTESETNRSSDPQNHKLTPPLLIE